MIAIKAIQYVTGRRYLRGYGFSRSSDGTGLFPQWVNDNPLRAIPDTRYPSPVLEIQSTGMDRWVYGNHQYPSYRVDADGAKSPCAAYSFSQYVMILADAEADRDGVYRRLGAPLIAAVEGDELFLDVARYQQVSEQDSARFASQDIDLSALGDRMDDCLMRRAVVKAAPERAALCAALVWEHCWHRYLQQKNGTSKQIQPLGVIVCGRSQQDTLADSLIFFFGQVFPLLPSAAQAMVSVAFAAAAEQEAQQAGSACLFFYDEPTARMRGNLMVFSDGADANPTDTVKPYVEEQLIAQTLMKGQLPAFFSAICEQTDFSPLWADCDLALSCCNVQWLADRENLRSGEIDAAHKQLVAIRAKLSDVYGFSKEQCASALMPMEAALTESVARISGYQATKEQIETWAAGYRAAATLPSTVSLAENYRRLLVDQTQPGEGGSATFLWDELVPKWTQFLGKQTEPCGEARLVLALCAQAADRANRSGTPLPDGAYAALSGLLSWAAVRSELGEDCDALRKQLCSNIRVAIKAHGLTEAHIRLVREGALREDAMDQAVTLFAKGETLRETLDNRDKIQLMAQYTRASRSENMQREMDRMLMDLADEPCYSLQDVDTFYQIVSALDAHSPEKVRALAGLISRVDAPLTDDKQAEGIAEFVNACHAGPEKEYLLQALVQRVRSEVRPVSLPEIAFYQKLANSLGQAPATTADNVAQAIGIHFVSQPLEQERFDALLTYFGHAGGAAFAYKTMAKYLARHEQDEQNPCIRAQMHALLAKGLMLPGGSAFFAGDRWERVRTAWEIEALWRWTDCIQDEDALLDFGARQQDAQAMMRQAMPWLGEAEWRALVACQPNERRAKLVRRVVQDSVGKAPLSRRLERWKRLQEWQRREPAGFAAEVSEAMAERLKSGFDELCDDCRDPQDLTTLSAVVELAKRCGGIRSISSLEPALSWCRDFAGALKTMAEQTGELTQEAERALWLECYRLTDSRHTVTEGWNEKWLAFLARDAEALSRKQPGCVGYACAFLAVTAKGCAGDSGQERKQTVDWHAFVRKAHPAAGSWQAVDLLRDKTQSLSFLSYVLDCFDRAGLPAWSEELAHCLRQRRMVNLPVRRKELEHILGVRCAKASIPSAADTEQLGLNPSLLRLLLIG